MYYGGLGAKPPEKKGGMVYDFMNFPMLEEYLWLNANGIVCLSMSRRRKNSTNHGGYYAFPKTPKISLNQGGIPR